MGQVQGKVQGHGQGQSLSWVQGLRNHKRQMAI